MAGLDVTEQALLYPEDFARIRAVRQPRGGDRRGLAGLLLRLPPHKGYAGAPVHDAVAVCALLRPDLLHFEDWHVTVETQGAFCRGATAGDRRTAPNARVITGIDREELRGTSDGGGAYLWLNIGSGLTATPAWTTPSPC